MDLLLLLGMLLLPALAQMWISTSYSKYKQIKNQQQCSGYEVARKILDENGLKDMYIVETNGMLSDHYDPNKKVVRLSKEIYHGETIAAMAVAAHECGHALQDKDGYLYMRFRSFIFPMVNAATSLSYFIIAMGLLFQSFNLIWLGIACVGTGLLFQIVTLPVELNASERAKKEIQKLNLAMEKEEQGVAHMLIAAASTYVAGVLSSALELIRFITILGNREE
ncbi:MAG: zinc metallopeptidase [Bacilli bacterium]|jgi:Zn-dependent membrane protease YugP|nr:zinc metallopeptidase [Bacilli bacterium]